MKQKKGIRKFYSKRFWYSNTYESLGSEWLKNSLEKLPVGKGYVLVNLSANAGYYERDTYISHQTSYSPQYIIGDINASVLKDTKVESFKEFKYLPGDNNAYDMDVTTLVNRADVIIDCKGALWYALVGAKTKRIDLLNLLNNYYKICKNKESMLIIDYYNVPEIKYVLTKFTLFFKGANHRKQKIYHFGEQSTYKFLKMFFDGEDFDTICKPLYIATDSNPDKPLAKYMNSATISAQAIEILIHKIEKMTDREYRKIKQKAKLEQFLVICILLSPVFFIILCLYVKFLLFVFSA